MFGKFLFEFVANDSDKSLEESYNWSFFGDNKCI